MSSRRHPTAPSRISFKSGHSGRSGRGGRGFLRGRSLAWIFGLCALSATGVFLVVSLVREVAREFPDVAILRSQYPVVEYAGPKEPFSIKLQKAKPAHWTALGAISKSAVGAIIVSEDWAFYQHPGFDANQIKEALKRDIESARFARGASTITQQVVKNVFLDRDKSLWRKVRELLLAVRLEKSVTKRRILEVYLNIIECGEGVFGVGSASRHYFKKPAAELTAKEGAFIAMLLPSPKRYSISFRKKALTPYARKTIESILFKMNQAGYLTDEELEAELERPMPFEAESETQNITIDESNESADESH